MLEVYFESDKEVISFCENLFCYNKQIELHWKTHEEWGNHIQFKHQLLNNEMIEAIAKSMVDVFVSHRLPSLIKKIIMDYYYFTDSDEIERILDLTNCIFEEGKYHDQSESEENFYELLHSLFYHQIIDAETIHYDSIIKFRLKTFKDQMLHIVGLAIDEFKQEEDHQAFIEVLRKYIAKKEAKYNEVHILQGSMFTFFTSSGKRFTNLDLRKIMHKEPLYIVGLDANELNLAPLVAMAPEKINIYGDNPSEPKTLTVINVFQEKVDFKPVHKFPFPYYSNKF